MENLLLLHGAIGAESQFGALRNAFEARFNCYSFNFSGHGGKEFNEPFRISKFVEELEVFLKENHIENPIIFGYSMGGMVALDLALKDTVSIKKIITLGTKFKWSNKIASKEVQLLNAEVIEKKVPRFASILKERHAPQDWKKVLAFTSEMMLNLGANPPSSKRWKSIKTPIAICLADDDHMVTEEESREVQNLTPGATFTQIKNSKHPIEQVNLIELEKMF